MLSVTMLLSVALVVVAQGVEEEIPMCSDTNSEEKIPQLKCPARAMCGTEWRTIRYWQGTTCRDHSIVHSCVCPGNTPCPVQNENHLFYESDDELQYLCEPRCDVEMCSTNTEAAVEMLQHSPDFNNYIYFKINCRCPGHNRPIATRPGVSSTIINKTHENKTTGVISTWYKCARDESLPGADTVCGGSRARRGRLGLLGKEQDSWA